MDVEQRHDVQATIAFYELQGSRDIVCRSRDIILRQRHDFRPRRRPGSVKYQRNVAGDGRAWQRGSAVRSARERESSRPSVGIRRQSQNRNPELFRRLDGSRNAAFFDDERLCA
jgi:hypothetical protein